MHIWTERLDELIPSSFGLATLASYFPLSLEWPFHHHPHQQQQSQQVDKAALGSAPWSMRCNEWRSPRLSDHATLDFLFPQNTSLIVLTMLNQAQGTHGISGYLYVHQDLVIPSASDNIMVQVKVRGQSTTDDKKFKSVFDGDVCMMAGEKAGRGVVLLRVRQRKDMNDHALLVEIVVFVHLAQP